jgi:hypothetical protein
VREVLRLALEPANTAADNNTVDTAADIAA